MTKFATDVPFHRDHLCTGNNVDAEGRHARDGSSSAGWSRPWNGRKSATTSPSPDLLEHVRAHRGELAVAALTILQGVSSSRGGRSRPTPKPKPMGGRSTAWANLVRRAVHWATDHDPSRRSPRRRRPTGRRPSSRR